MTDNVGINRNPSQRKMVVTGVGTMLYSALFPAGVRSLYGIKREQQYREKQ
jgi:hypothetical protein